MNPWHRRRAKKRNQRQWGVPQNEQSRAPGPGRGEPKGGEGNSARGARNHITRRQADWQQRQLSRQTTVGTAPAAQEETERAALAAHHDAEPGPAGGAAERPDAGNHD